MPGRQRRQPPADEVLPRPEGEAAPIAGHPQQVVELVERNPVHRRRQPDAGRWCPQWARPAAVVADDLEVHRLGLAHPLARGLRQAGERGRFVEAGQRQTHPVARGLELLDRPIARRR